MEKQPLQNKEQLKTQIEKLKLKLSGDMMKDMEIRDQIHNLEMKINGTKPMDSHIDCEGCGS
jgi:hypothetical protein